MRGDPAVSPTLGVQLLQGSDGTPGDSKGKAMEVQGGHWAPHGCPGLAAKGHKPLGMSDPPAWGGMGQLAGLGVRSWTGTLQGGFGSNRNQPGIFLVQGFIHSKMNSLGASTLGADIGGPGRQWGAQPLPLTGACIPPRGAMGARPCSRHPLKSCSAVLVSCSFFWSSCTMA